jgi:sugar/nucleoside kinase (ribokinase family)
MKPEEIVDSNGAGDAFVGGFLAGYALSKPIEKCVKAGFYSAWEILKVHGTNLKSKSPSFSWD